MVKNRSIFIAFLLTGILIVSTLLLPNMTDASSKAPDGSMIANIDVDGKSDDEIKQMLKNEAAIWQNGNDIIMESDFEQMMMPRSAVQFDIEETIKQFNEATKRTLSNFFMRPKDVNIPLTIHIDEKNEAIQTLKNIDRVDDGETLAQVKALARQLDDSSITLTYIDGKNLPLETIAEVELDISDTNEAVLTHIVDELNHLIVKPDSSFSFLKIVQFPETVSTLEKEVNLLATALYELFLQTNFDIIERHAGSAVPTYARPGVNAEISVESRKDLIVMNRENASYQIDISKSDESLYIGLKGLPQEMTYEYEVDEVKEIKQRTLYRYSQKLAEGEEKVIQKGRKGLTVDVYRTHYSPDNIKLDSEKVSTDTYVPVPKIILVSTDEEDSDEQIEEQEEERDRLIEETDELEQRVDSLEAAINVEQEETVDSDVSGVTKEQIKEIREAQADIQEKIQNLEDKLKDHQESTEKDIENQEDKLNRRIKKLKEKYVKILEQLIEQQESEVESEQHD